MERDVFKMVREALKSLTRPELSKLHWMIHECGIFSDCVQQDDSMKAALELIRLMKDACHVDVTSPSRRMYVRLCRWCVAEDLLELNYSLTSIGKILNRDHSTASYYARKIRDIREHPSMYPDYYDIKRKYQEQKDRHGYHSLQDIGRGPETPEGKEIQAEEIRDSLPEDT